MLSLSRSSNREERGNIFLRNIRTHLETFRASHPNIQYVYTRSCKNLKSRTKYLTSWLPTWANFINVVTLRGSVIIQSVLRLAKDWSVRGSNLCRGQPFTHPPRSALGRTQPPLPGILGFSSAGGKRPGQGVNRPPPPPPSAKMKNEDIYSSSPGTEWNYLYVHLLGWREKSWCWLQAGAV